MDREKHLKELINLLWKGMYNNLDREGTFLSTKDWGYSSVAECLPRAYDVLGLLTNITLSSESFHFKT